MEAETSNSELDLGAIGAHRKNAIKYAVKYLSKDKRIIVVDGLNPEDNAMIQALYSRDPKSVLKHLEKLDKEGSGKVMGLFYVGYGHGSIGQCGFTTICLENVSMLVAKAFQDSSLYNGQESSTRYLNMSLQTTKNPAGTEFGVQLQKKSMAFYEKVLVELIPALKIRFPKPECKEVEEEKIAKFNADYEKSIKAKAFDIARGFLPAGVTTYLSWTTSLQHAKQRFDLLMHHPVAEVRDIAASGLLAMKEAYPDSFGHKTSPENAEYECAIAEQIMYHDLPYSDFKITKNTLDAAEMFNYKTLLEKRPEYSDLPQMLNECGQLRATFPIDFGSFRDMQRHRPWVLKMPLLTLKHGFFPWYLEQLPVELRIEVEAHLAVLEQDIIQLDVSDAELQNYIPMGYTVQTETTGGLSQYVYVCELRTKQTVHPTYRISQQQMATYLKSWFKESVGFDLVLYADMSDDVFSLKRGTQDIVQKSAT